MTDVLGIGTSTLTAIQNALSTVGHNISNSATEGYSKQTSSLATRPPQLLGTQYLGAGVNVTTTKRAVDQVLTGMIRDNVSAKESFFEYQEHAKQVNSLLADEATSISRSMEEFYGSLYKLTADPQSSASRSTFLSEANNMVDKFKNTEEKLSNMIKSTNNQIINIVGNINELTKAIVEINDQINSSSGGGNYAPNDLLDKRDLSLKELSKYTKISTVENITGAVDVYMGSGQNLVMGNTRLSLSVEQNSQDPNLLKIFTNDSRTGAKLYEITGQLSEGKLGGLMDVRTQCIDKSSLEIGRIAISIASVFNEQHKLGVNMNGELGGNLFTDINDPTLALSRSLADSDNRGNASISINIDPMSHKQLPPYHNFSSNTGLLDPSAILGINSPNKLIFNGISVSSTASDGISTAASSASAIAISNAINLSSNSHFVTAKAKANVINLGNFTAGSIDHGQLSLNGVNIISSGNSASELLADINDQISDTGVEAYLEQNNIMLMAKDGRNIELITDGNSLASFSNFDMSSAPDHKVARAAVELVSQDYLTISGEPQDYGFIAGNYPEKNVSLQASDYKLSYANSNFTLIRNSDQKVLYSGKQIDGFSVDGFTISINNANFREGDIYNIKPTARASSLLDLKISNIQDLALTSPIKINQSSSNLGTGRLSIDTIKSIDHDPSISPLDYGNAFNGSNSMQPPIRIEFISDTAYKVFDISNVGSPKQIGPIQDFDPNGSRKILPIVGVSKGDGLSGTYVYDPGFALSLAGEPLAGDHFDINFNSDAISDNYNINKMIEISSSKFIDQETSSFSETYFNLVSDMGSNTRRSDISLNAATSLLQQSELRRESTSGVNLDEEAAKLLKYEQVYNAASQLINISKQMFQSLLSALTGR